MTDRIRILDSTVVSKIAAGEVVERPASVVKELVENSIDAGAVSVTVTVRGGGRRLIRVVDDGEGMSKRDALLCLTRHATSKIEDERSLDSITTMGFRGEALWSISAVSRLVLRTRPRGDMTGTMVTVEGGIRRKVVDTGSPEGTTVEVRDLFYNVPARRKFLRSESTELGRIVDVVRRIALVHPDRSFRLFHGTKILIDAPRGDRMQRMSDLFGYHIKERLIPIEGDGIYGFVGLPEYSFPTTRSIYIYVNNRPISDRGINRAIISGFGSILEEGRYPFVFLNLLIPPGDVDVNVHPQKSEVRFRYPGTVFSLVTSSIRSALSQRGPVYTKPRVPEGVLSVNEGGETFSLPVARDEREHRTLQVLEKGTEKEDNGILNPEFLRVDVVGQLWGEFLLVQSEEGDVFYIIDQHGAAERIAFERLKKAYYSGRDIERQFLLLPERVETTPDERDCLERVLPILERLGFEIVPFGPSSGCGGETFIVKAVPSILGGRRCGGLVKDLAEELAGTGMSSRVDDSVDEVFMRIACHSVVRGRRVLSKEEIRALLKDLAGIDLAGYCPHGRPIVKRFTRKEIEGFFKR